MDQCIVGICFVALEAAAPKFFGFSEFLAALALMVLVWTTTDTRYRFRIATAPIPLHRLTFFTVAGVGTLTLLTDLWRAQEWLVPAGRIITPAAWQAVLGAFFLLTFLAWAWFAFVRPPRFGPRNAHRFGAVLLQKITEASPSDMAILAHELIRSIPALIEAAPSLSRFGGSQAEELRPTEPQQLAYEILLLMGDPRFCRVLVASSPGTIHCLFDEIGRTEKFGVPVAQIGRNVITAAVENEESFLYQEGEGYLTGLLGYWKPVSQAVFGNYRMAANIDSLLDADIDSRRKWTAQQWRAYNRAVLLIVRSYVETEFWNHSTVLARAFGAIQHATSDLYKIDGAESGGWEEDSYQRLGAAVEFCAKVMEILDEHGVPDHLRWRLRDDDPPYLRTLYDELTDLIFHLIGNAAKIRRPWDLCWSVQHNTVWTSIFGGLGEAGAASAIIRFKLRRRLYDEIVSAAEWPNFENTRYLGYCLNVMGLNLRQGKFHRESLPLQRAVLEWTKRNYATLEEKAPHVFAECLPGGLSYDKDKCRLVKTYQVTAFRAEPEQVFYELDPPARDKPGSRA